MKHLLLLTLLLVIAGTTVFAQRDSSKSWYLQSEKQIEGKEPGPHKGGGNTTAYRFFKDIPGSKLQLTRRILEPGAGIGYHLQKEEEIYYVLSGTGEMNMNGDIELRSISCHFLKGGIADGEWRMGCDAK